MNFEYALRKIQSGEKVRRSCWEKGHFWRLNEMKRLVNSAGLSPEINEKQLEAEDWEISNEHFCLSDRMATARLQGDDGYIAVYPARDVILFIQNLKERVRNDKYLSVDEILLEPGDIDEEIDKLAGKKLI